jgi:hypothetical protein
VAAVDDPTVPSSVDLAIVLWTLDGAGNLILENVIVKEGDVLPGQTRPVRIVGTGPNQLALNDAGEVMFFAGLTGDPATDGCIYKGTVAPPLAQEGSPSPIAGRTWGNLSAHGMDLNDAGEYVFQADLDSSDLTNDRVIVRNGAIVRQEGTAPPGQPPALRAVHFGPSDGPVRIDDAGQMFSFVQWGVQGFKGYYVNDTLKVRETVTSVAGNTIRSLPSGPMAFTASHHNQVLAFRAAFVAGNVPRVIILDTGSASAPVGAPIVAPRPVALLARPNPFRQSTEVVYSLERAADVMLEAFDVSGRRILQLDAGLRAPGDHVVTWSGRDGRGRRVGAGVYFLRLSTGDRRVESRVLKVE